MSVPFVIDVRTTASPPIHTEEAVRAIQTLMKGTERGAMAEP